MRLAKVLEVGEVARSSRCPLHRSEVVERAQRKPDPEDLHLLRARPQLGIARHTGETLHDVERAERGVDLDQEFVEGGSAHPRRATPVKRSSA